MENTNIREYYSIRMRRNDLFLTVDAILYYNWRAISFWRKIKYLLANKCNLEQSKFQNALDRLSALDPEDFNNAKPYHKYR